jgi:hypothetical protein
VSLRHIGPVTVPGAPETERLHSPGESAPTSKSRLACCAANDRPGHPDHMACLLRNAQPTSVRRVWRGCSLVFLIDPIKQALRRCASGRGTLRAPCAFVCCNQHPESYGLDPAAGLCACRWQVGPSAGWIASRRPSGQSSQSRTPFVMSRAAQPRRRSVANFATRGVAVDEATWVACGCVWSLTAANCRCDPRRCKSWHL